MNRSFFLAAVVAAVALFATPKADAAFRLRVESGTATGPGVVITDESASESGIAGGFAGTPNALNVTALALGPFTLSATTGTSTPVTIAPGFFEAQDLTNVSIFAGAAGVLRLILEKDTYGAETPDGDLGFRTDVGGVLTAGIGSSVTFNSYADDTSAMPDLGPDVNPVGALAPVTGIPAVPLISQTFGPGVFMASNEVAFSKTGGYSMYQIVTVTFTSAGSVSFNMLTGTTPAPAGLVLLASAAPVLAFGWLRRRKVAPKA